jgi:alpha-ketoglutarate-dependent taurine dioxygenase
MRSKLSDIKDAIEANGYVILEPWDSTPETLRTVGSIFGRIQSHIRANEYGVVGETQQGDPEWKKFKSEYHGLGTGEFAPHTDGTFVDGALIDGSSLIRVGPPAYILLQIVRNAGEGGASIIVDGQRVMRDILMNEEDMARVLMRPGAITYCRDDQLALDLPVYAAVGDGHYDLRFRSDSKAYTPSWSQAAVERLHSEYHMSPSYRERILLNEGQILVCDNTRVLHGREPFSEEDTGAGSGRKLRRLWIMNEHTPVLHNLEGEKPTSRALDPYKPYAPVANDLALTDVPKFSHGIHLDEEARAIARRLHVEIAERRLQPN